MLFFLCISLFGGLKYSTSLTKMELNKRDKSNKNMLKICVKHDILSTYTHLISSTHKKLWGLFYAKTFYKWREKTLWKDKN